MQFWFVCCVLLFAAFHAYAWIAHRALALPQLGLPWVILGGIGLAIASNYGSFKEIETKVTSPMEKQPQQPLPPSPTDPLPKSGLLSEFAQPHSKTVKPSGISFEISSQSLKQNQT